MFVIPSEAISDINVPVVYRPESKRATAARMAAYAHRLAGVTHTMRRGVTTVWATRAEGVTRYVNVTLLFNNTSFSVLRKEKPSCVMPIGLTPVFPAVESVYAKLIPRRLCSCS